MTMFRNLGRTLQLLREEQGWSQADLARKAGIGKSQLSKYENSKEQPRLDSLEKILAALSVRYVDFFTTVSFLDDQLERLSSPSPLPAVSAPHASGLLSDDVNQAFERVTRGIFELHRSVLHQLVAARARS
jgi:transcriptional regulator with XRE-family HTH domain